MNPIRIIFVLSVMISLIPTMALSQNTPESAVHLYCSLDGYGAGYSNNQEHRKEFNNAQIDSVENAWDESTIIRDYEIIEINQAHGNAEVTVLYNVLGVISSDLSVNSSVSSEKVVFNVIRTDGVWKIDHSELGPHITKSGILKILKEQRSDAIKKAQISNNKQIGDPLTRLENAIDIIEKW